MEPSHSCFPAGSSAFRRQYRLDGNWKLISSPLAVRSRAIALGGDLRRRPARWPVSHRENCCSSRPPRAAEQCLRLLYALRGGSTGTTFIPSVRTEHGARFNATGTGCPYRVQFPCCLRAAAHLPSVEIIRFARTGRTMNQSWLVHVDPLVAVDRDRDLDAEVLCITCRSISLTVPHCR